MPLRPVLAPLMDRLRRTTGPSAAGLVMFTVMAPVLPADRMPASVPSPESVMALVMVTIPKPPGSSTEISPNAAVFEIAPANVLHGAVRLHGFASSPTPDTQVRVACAWAIGVMASTSAPAASVLITERFIGYLLFYTRPVQDLRNRESLGFAAVRQCESEHQSSQ